MRLEESNVAKAMDNPEIAAMLRGAVRHAANNSMDLRDEVMRLPASSYTDPDRFAIEIDMIFKRLPLLLAPSAEIPTSGAFKTMEVAGVPLLVVRGSDGTARAFINSCSHRGTMVVTEERGTAARFTCPYHGWTFGQQGNLIAVTSSGDFGEIDKSCYGLTELRTAERAGLIFGSVDPNSQVDIDQFLSGYDRLLEYFNFKDWHFFAKRSFTGPNWKIAFDGNLDFYHIPTLHSKTLGGPGGFKGPLGNRALFHAWGPHQKILGTDRKWKEMASMPEAEWPESYVMTGVWTLFPNVSIASFDGGGRGVMITQLLPGKTVGECITVQNYLLETAPDEEAAARAHAQFNLLEDVVRGEDYAVGLTQQQALQSGARDHVLFGRNEGGGQTFHSWVERVVNTPDKDLNGLFAPSAR